jgi:hypothetical protein
MYKQDMMFMGGGAVAGKGECIKQTALISKILPSHKFEKPSSFKPDDMKTNMDVMAPKLQRMLDHIKELDEKDMRADKHLYKHAIYVDFKGAYAKIVASALIAGGFSMAFDKSFKLDEAALLKKKSKNFGFLCGSTLYDKTFPVKFKKEVNVLYNRRPDNVYGEYIRFMLLDSAHREGVDLYDVKYVHILQDPQALPDRKQAIGRATRLCGQKGLRFQPNKGWKLYVYIYDQQLPEELQSKERGIETIHDLYMSTTQIDLRLVKFAPELDKMVEYVAVDKDLTEYIHNPSKSTSSKLPTEAVADAVPDAVPDADFLLLDKTAHGGKNKNKNKKPIVRPKAPTTKKTLAAMSEYVVARFKQYKWPQMELTNKCGYAGPGSEKSDTGGADLVEFSPTQQFMRFFFQPTSAYKGILAHHSVGTGKTCMAIATATTSWEPMKYTILYVTRTSLKSDVYKNMFTQVCSLVLKQDMKHGLVLPDNATKTPSKYLSDRWLLPISFKQFSNLCEGKNKIFHEMVKRNGTADPLKKTLVIVDEAHKLYAPDVIGAEKPNTKAIEEAIQKSYIQSGGDSVRLLLMTGTPYTSNPMDLIKLTNLLRTESEQLPTDFDAFSKEFLDDTNEFSESGKKIFGNKMAGYISYLNREHDARQFTIPTIKTITVPLSTKQGPTMEEVAKELDIQKESIDSLKEDIKQVKQKHKAIVSSRVERECSSIPVKQRKPCKKDVTDQQDTELRRVLRPLETELEVKKAHVDELKKQKKEATSSKKNDLSQESMLVSRCKRNNS